MNGTLHQIAQELAAALERLEKGDLQLEEVGPLTDQARELYERLVALRYVAIERLVKPSEGKEGAFLYFIKNRGEQLLLYYLWLFLYIFQLAHLFDSINERRLIGMDVI